MYYLNFLIKFQLGGRKRHVDEPNYLKHELLDFSRINWNTASSLCVSYLYFKCHFKGIYKSSYSNVNVSTTAEAI